MDEGSFDVKGLAEHAVRYGLVKAGMQSMTEEVLPFVGLGLDGLKVPHKLNLDPVATLLGKLIVNGVQRQKDYDSRLKQSADKPASDNL